MTGKPAKTHGGARSGREVAPEGVAPDGAEARSRLLANAPVKEHRMDLAGISTSVLVGGDGPPMVLLHGPGESSLWWLRVLPRLVASHRVVAPDLPGHGESAVLSEPLDERRLVAWLDALLDRTAAEPTILVGHALGGAVAVRYAVQRSDRLRHLVLVDSLGLKRFFPDPRFGFRLMRFLMRPTERNYARFLGQCMCDAEGLKRQMGADWPPFLDYYLSRVREPGVKRNLQWMMGRFGVPGIPSGDLAQIGVPTALIWGREDRAVPLRVAKRAADRYDWPLHVVEDARDDPKLERPEAFLRALHGSLRETSPVATP